MAGFGALCCWCWPRRGASAYLYVYFCGILTKLWTVDKYASIRLNLMEHPSHLQIDFHGYENYVDAKVMSYDLKIIIQETLRKKSFQLTLMAKYKVGLWMVSPVGECIKISCIFPINIYYTSLFICVTTFCSCNDPLKR